MPERVAPERSAHPVLFLILFLPMGISNGYAVVTLGYLLSKAGVSLSAIAVLVSLSLLPQTWKFLGGPLVDTTFSNKSWFLASAIATGVLMAATGCIPPAVGNLALIDTLVLVFNVAAAFNALAADSIMAHATTADTKGQAGGWSQAGNLGGTGLGGGAGLWLSQHYTPAWLGGSGTWLAQHANGSSVAGASLGLACVVACFVLPLVREPVMHHRAKEIAESLVGVGRDVWSVMSSRVGLLAFVAFILPIGVGSASNLWAAVAGDWHASADIVALINGALGGVISMAGCIAGGWICDRMDRRTAFNLFSIVTALGALAMLVAARTQEMFVVFTCTYALLTGFCYAGFGAVDLEAIGTGAAATKYNLLASVANVPIIYMALIEGWAHSKWGADGFLVAEVVLPVAGTGVFLLFALALRRLFPANSVTVSA